MDLLSYNRQGRLFCAANVSAKSVIAVAAGMTGFILYNPPSSGRVLAVAHVGFVWTTAPAAVHNIGLAIGAASPTALSGLTAVGSGVMAANGYGNAGSAVARVYDAATLPAAPVAARWFMGGVYGSGVGESPYVGTDNVDGAIILVPGSSMSFTVVTTTAVGLASATWAEIDL